MIRGGLLTALLLAATWAAGAQAVEQDAPVVLAVGTEFEAIPLAMLLKSSEPLAFSSFRLESERLVLYTGTRLSYELAQGETGWTYQDYHNRTELTNVTITLDGPAQGGHVGIHSHNESTRLRFVPNASCVVQPSADSEFSTTKGNGGYINGHNSPSSSIYYRHVREPHLRMGCIGDLRFEGEHLLQVEGLTLRIESDQGIRRFRTGIWEETQLLGVVPQTRWQWANLEAERMVLSASSPLAWDVAVREVRTPHLVITYDQTLVLADSRAPLAPPVQGAGAGFLLASALVVAGCAVLGGGILFHRARRRRLRSALEDPREPWDAEECVQRAEVHIQTERFDRALDWILLARRMAPTSASVSATQAFLLGMLDRVDEALDAYREASRLAPDDGEPDLSAARLALERDQPLPVVEQFVERALQKSPRLVQEVDEQGEFSVLAGRPRFEHAVSAAWDAFVGHVSRDGPE